jgi:hypothetical protein
LQGARTGALFVPPGTRPTLDLRLNSGCARQPTGAWMGGNEQ